MAIIGVGTDLCETARFARGRCSEQLIRRVFTSAEIAYCRSQRVPEQNFAARFAGKEAAIKALSSLFPHLTVSQIEVAHRAGTRAAELRFCYGARSAPPPAMPSDLVLHVSLSHEAGLAAAIVVAERADASRTSN